MRRASMLICLALLAVPLVTMGQAPLLINPDKAPLTLKGGWIHHKTGQRSDLVIRIEAIQPDGTFTGRLDYFNVFPAAACKAIDAPIKEGKVTDKMFKAVVEGQNPGACPLIAIVLRPGGEKWLEGQSKYGDKTWLDAPK
ncbi:MAG: hypothetical protein U5L03_00080 [Burkholderiaceae bacterium]|nr:hypothetical protein [Burkholderiaceae bacterium]